MGLRITIDVFSGRPNPVVEVPDDEAAALLERLAPVRRVERGEADVPPAPTLGYRGVIIEQTGDRTDDFPEEFRLAGDAVLGRGLRHRVRDDAVEEFICGNDGPLRRLDLDPDFFARLREEMERFRELRRSWPWDRLPVALPWLRRCACAPPYEPGWWNVPQRQPHNNCYNYATNYRSDTFAQPGQAAGAMYANLTCTDVLAGAVADELVDTPDADNKCPDVGHLVALVVAPGWDFHWYRKGRNGRWTHKPGGTAVTELDNAGAFILDPRLADRGPYTDFCTFMVVMHGHIKLQ